MLGHRLGSRNLLKRFSIYPRILNRHVGQTSENTDTVDLAYASYESTTDADSSRPPLVILHGLLGSKNNWNSMSKAIHRTTGRKVISVDARNHGDSRHSPEHTYVHMAHDVMKLLKKLELSRVSLLGHSMGGRTAMVLSLLCPDKVSGLVVVDISPISSPNTASDFFPKLIEAMKSVSFDVENLTQAREKAKEALLKSNVLEEGGTLNFILMNIGKRNGKFGWIVNLDTLKKHWKDIATFPAEVAKKKYEGPTIFIAGSKSHFVPPSNIVGIKKIFPKAELHFLDAGHNVHIEKADEFVSLVNTFVNKMVK